MSMSITCRECGGSDFVKKHGAFACRRCNTISEEHGAETELDIASIGGYSSDVASTLRSRKIDGRKRGGLRGRDDDRRSFAVSFTHADAFTFVLKAWVEEVEGLAGMPALGEVALTLWARYLGALGEAFVPAGTEPALSARPSFRDLQVRMFGRRKVLTRKRVKNIQAGKWRQTRKSAGPDSVDPNDESREARIVRRRKRREFLRAVAAAASGSEGDDGGGTGGSSQDSDASLASFASEATFLSDASGYGASSSTFGGLGGDDFDDDGGGAFGGASSSGLGGDESLGDVSAPSFALNDLSRSSFADDSRSEWDTIADDHLASVAAASVASGPSSATGESASSIVERRRAESAAAAAEAARDREHAAVLSNLRSPRKASETSCGVGHLSLRSTFAVLCLAALTAAPGRTAVVLADMLRWARTGAISYRTAVRNVPPVMQLKATDDFNRLVPLADPTRTVVAGTMYGLACLLDLRQMDFGAHGNLGRAVRRFCKELSLPRKLWKVLEAAVADCPVLSAVAHDFPAGAAAPRANAGHKLPSVDARALALLLFALKYLYGMDDESEELHSEAARRHNLAADPGRKKSRFVVSDWLRMSRERVFLACRHSDVLAGLLDPVRPPGLPRSAAAEAAAAIREADEAAERDQVAREEPPGGAARAGRMDRLRCLFEAELGGPETAPSAACPDLTDSTLPLRAFSKHFAPGGAGEGVLCREDSEMLQELLSMHKSTVVGMQRSDPGSAEAAPAVPWRRGNMVRSHYNYRRSAAGGSSDEEEEEGELYTETRRAPASAAAAPGVPMKVAPRYWRLRPKKFGLSLAPADADHEGARDLVLADLPDGFSWVLRYLAALAGMSPPALLAELTWVEEVVAVQDPDYFGPVAAGWAATRGRAQLQNVRNKSIKKTFSPGVSDNDGAARRRRKNP